MIHKRKRPWRRNIESGERSNQRWAVRAEQPAAITYREGAMVHVRLRVDVAEPHGRPIAASRGGQPVAAVYAEPKTWDFLVTAN